MSSGGISNGALDVRISRGLISRSYLSNCLLWFNVVDATCVIYWSRGMDDIGWNFGFDAGKPVISKCEL
mgnify:CR=1 FL=1